MTSLIHYLVVENRHDELTYAICAVDHVVKFSSISPSVFLPTKQLPFI